MLDYLISVDIQSHKIEHFNLLIKIKYHQGSYCKVFLLKLILFSKWEGKNLSRNYKWDIMILIRHLNNLIVKIQFAFWSIQNAFYVHRNNIIGFQQSFLFFIYIFLANCQSTRLKVIFLSLFLIYPIISLHKINLPNILHRIQY